MRLQGRHVLLSLALGVAVGDQPGGHLTLARVPVAVGLAKGQGQSEVK